MKKISWNYTTEGSFMLEHVKDRIRFAHEILVKKKAIGEESPKPVKLYINNDKGYIKPETAIESIEGGFTFVTEINFNKKFYWVDISKFHKWFMQKRLFSHHVFDRNVKIKMMFDKKMDLESHKNEILNKVLNDEKLINEYMEGCSLYREYNADLHQESCVNYWKNVDEMIDDDATSVMNRIDDKHLIPKDYLFINSVNRHFPQDMCEKPLINLS